MAVTNNVSRMINDVNKDLEKIKVKTETKKKERINIIVLFSYVKKDNFFFKEMH